MLKGRTSPMPFSGKFLRAAVMAAALSTLCSFISIPILMLVLG